MCYPSTGDSIPAVHRTSYPASRPADPSTVSSDSHLSVAAAHHDAEGVDVRLRERVYLKPRHEALAVVFTDGPPAHDSTVVVEPLIMSELEFLESSSSSVFEKISVARTFATWHAADGSVAVQVANPSPDGVALPIDLCLGQLFTMSIVTPDQLHVNAPAKTPTSVDEIAQAKSEIEGPLSKAFTNTKLTPDQKVSALDLCAWYHPVFALSMSELGRCTNAKATFPLPPDIRPIDRPPYRANPRAKAVIDKCVRDKLGWGIIEERPSPWDSPCTLVAKKNGSPRFCVDYRHTLNRNIVRKSWPLPNLDSSLDSVGDVKLISTADVLSAFWQLPVAEEHIDRTAFVTPTGKLCFKRMFLEFVMPHGCFEI